MNLFKQIAAKNTEITEFPFFSELNIEAFIIENPQILSNDKINNPEIIDSQIHLKAGRSEGDGRIDLLAKTDNDILLIIEIKNGKLKEEHYKQLTDYISAFEKRKIDIMKEVDTQNDYSNYEIKGLLIGLDITEDLKNTLLKGSESLNSEIIGIIINRYRTSDSMENYILTDYIAPPENIQRIRYKNWEDFENKQKDNGVNSNIIKLVNQIYKDFIISSELPDVKINFTPTTFTLNVPLTQRRKVFAYIKIKKNAISIDLVNNGVRPVGTLPHQNPSRYPNWHTIILSTEKEYNNDVKKLIKDSYGLVMNYSK